MMLLPANAIFRWSRLLQTAGHTSASWLGAPPTNTGTGPPATAAWAAKAIGLLVLLVAVPPVNVAPPTVIPALFAVVVMELPRRARLRSRHRENVRGGRSRDPERFLVPVDVGGDDGCDLCRRAATHVQFTFRRLMGDESDDLAVDGNRVGVRGNRRETCRSVPHRPHRRQAMA